MKWIFWGAALSDRLHLRGVWGLVVAASPGFALAGAAGPAAASGFGGDGGTE